ncbi:MAG: multicopper oxidase domain-containing protein [Acetobacteraceae bacterium]|nr:multicopper oxidase domain-containing protein [Acetobacteraceae bacterium]
MFRRDLLLGTAAASVAGAFERACAHAANGAQPALPIPSELKADAGGTIALDARPATMQFQSGVTTPTYGINGAYLGPAIRVRRGETVVANVSNNVSENITIHWHGLVIPGAADGGPYQIIPPGKRWQVKLSIDQPAATLWFHPHLCPTTAELVIKGLAGLMIVNDQDSESLLSPSIWAAWRPSGPSRENTHAGWPRAWNSAQASVGAPVTRNQLAKLMIDLAMGEATEEKPEPATPTQEFARSEP